MDRIISPEERIRRAEEIYYKRKAQGVRVSTASVNIGKANKVSLGRKMVIQILVCLVIYFCFMILNNYNNVFSENIISETKAVLSYDVNFANLYNQCKEYFNNNINNIIKKEDKNQSENNVDGENKNQEKNSGNQEGENSQNSENNDNTDNQKEENNAQNNQNAENSSENGSENGENTENTENIENNHNAENNQNQQEAENQTNNLDNQNNQENTQDGIGGGADISLNSLNDGTIKAKQDFENKTQMEQDAKYAKQNFNFIKPIEGRITSGFGRREETEIVSAFHQGIDISGKTGTPIKAAIEGTVVAASWAGDYR